MKCQSCGHTVLRRAQFCAHCGAPVIPRAHQQKTPTEKPRWPIYAALVVGGILLGALAVNFLITKEAPPSAGGHTQFDGTLRGAALAQQYPAVFEVAAQFVCPCGTCTDGLEVCDCGMTRGSTEVRTLIFELLQQHHAPHVVELIAKEFGHRKTATAPTLTIPAFDSTQAGWARPR